MDALALNHQQSTVAGVKRWYKACRLMMGISPDYIEVEGLLGGELLDRKEASPYWEGLRGTHREGAHVILSLVDSNLVGVDPADAEAGQLFEQSGIL